MSTVFHLTRLSDDGVQTLGRLDVIRDGREVFSCHALERPWKNNARRVSCIPPGPGGTARYRLRHRWSPKFRDHLDLIGEEPERSLVLVHAGNTYLHTVGCILPGDSLRDINGDGRLDVLNSADTLARLRSFVPSGGEVELFVFGVGYEPEGEATAARLKEEARRMAEVDARDGVTGGVPLRPAEPLPALDRDLSDDEPVVAPTVYGAPFPVFDPAHPTPNLMERFITNPAAGVVAKVKAQWYTALLPLALIALNFVFGLLGLPSIEELSLDGIAMWVVLAGPMLIQWLVQWLTSYFTPPNPEDKPVPAQK